MQPPIGTPFPLGTYIPALSQAITPTGSQAEMLRHPGCAHILRENHPQISTLYDTWPHHNSQIRHQVYPWGLGPPFSPLIPWRLTHCDISESLPQPLPGLWRGASGQWEPQPPLRGVWSLTCPGPYLPAGHHGQSHLVPEVKFSNSKLHGSPPGTAVRGESVNTSLQGSLPALAHPPPPGESLLQPLALRQPGAHTWFLQRTPGVACLYQQHAACPCTSFLTLSGPGFPPPYHVNIRATVKSA